MSPTSDHTELADPPPPPTVSPTFDHAELADPPRPTGDPSTPAGRPTPPTAPGAPRPAMSRDGRVDVSVEPATLAERQAALVAALVASAPDPAGFDPPLLAATRRALLRKRAGEAAVAWPLLAASLGDRWASAFAAHHSGREPGGALRDGWDLARALRAELSADAAAELAEREATLHYDGSSAPRPRRLARAWLALARFVH